LSKFQATVDDKLVDVRELAMSRRHANESILGIRRHSTLPPPSKEERFSEFGKAYYSGAEYLELATVTVTALGGAGGLIGFGKAAKDIITTWMKGKSHRSVTIKRGSQTITVKGSVSDEEIKRAVELSKILEDDTPIQTGGKRTTKKQIKKTRLRKAAGHSRVAAVKKRMKRKSTESSRRPKP
jgi:hypothetical protein